MLKDYETFVDGRCKPYVDKPYTVIALNEEAGEIAGWFKKVELRRAPNGLTEEDLLGELGDVQFYLARLAHLYGWTLKDVMQHNMDKLQKREKAGAVSANG